MPSMPIDSGKPRPLIAITMGDPCGVGPEIIVKALGSRAVRELCAPLVVGDAGALERAVDLLGADVKVQVIATADSPGLRESGADGDGWPGTMHVITPEKLSLSDMVYGRPTQAACGAVVRYIETAVRMALGGEVQAVCTCPIHKANLHRHGFQFPGHTEFIRDLTGASDVVMMLAGPRLRVSLVTIHDAISEVPRLLTTERILKTVRITGDAMIRDFGLAKPRIALAGLNPHAGEEGRFGDEERTVIEPAIRQLQQSAYDVSGPYPPDTLFHRAYEGEFDAVVAMYHDQGLIPIKLVHFYEAVNVSLGMSIIRTSVDHGTAYDLAGTGKAHSGSLEAALRLASVMARNRARA
jgi:4-hydroxythreonine-4-phosphate dehydrogenase